MSIMLNNYVLLQLKQFKQYITVTFHPGTKSCSINVISYIKHIFLFTCSLTQPLQKFLFLNYHFFLYFAILQLRAATTLNIITI